MLGSMMVGLDGSKHGAAAVELGILWAKRLNATLVGVAVLDEPGICHGDLVPLGGSSFKEHRDQVLLAEARQKVQGFLSGLAEQCRRAGVCCELRQESGVPWERLNDLAHECDLILFGSKTFFHFETQDEPDDTINRIVKNAPRPVVAVPESFNESGDVVIGFDGSLQATRALQLFVALGLGSLRPVHVVSTAGQQADAERVAARAKRYLANNKIDATVHVVTSGAHPSEVLLDHVRSLGAGVLVMGAYGQPFLREFFFGSTTRRVLEAATVPVFLYH
jgi:nucleotide-binding universal stress UspA family protein